MFENASAGWWFITVLSNAVGTAFMLYGIKQRRLYHLLFGVALGACPYFVANAWLALLICAVLTVVFVLFIKYRSPA
ncbi:MAG: hypothetical protein JW909_09500 [Planctomycetes bacterium]|nr:hypothetical protein [Planctomycetota bacterium]